MIKTFNEILNLRVIKPVLKLCKVSKYYEQDYLKIYLLLYTSLRIIQISEPCITFALIEKIYQK